MDELRILAFGDSLTEGYYFFGRKFHPYSLRLQSLVDSKLTSEKSTNATKNLPSKISVCQHGVSGERTSSMVQRLPKVIESYGPFHFMVFLGGTNDLGDDYNKVFDNIVNIIESARANGITPVLVTIPELSAERKFSDLYESRTQLNQRIFNYSNEHKLPLVDLAVHLPMYSTKNHEETLKYWEHDGLHMTPEGYDRFADLIFEQLGPILF